VTKIEQELWRLVDVTRASSASLDVDTILGPIGDGVVALLEADTVVDRALYRAKELGRDRVCVAPWGASS
jgi:PleD family two-component response regulator